MINSALRPAVAMIELIFAIVIIGIVLLSAPQLISTSTQSGYVAVQQEAISEAATKVNIILGHSWDENDTDELFIPPVLAVTNGNSFLNEINTTGRRVGTPASSNRSFFRSDGLELNASAIGQDGGDMDDMDDFDDPIGVTVALTPIEGSSADYIETTTVHITTNVKYGDDNSSNGNYNDLGGDTKITFSPTFTNGAPATTNIKFITVNLTSSASIKELDKNITLNAFSANIGGYDLEERVY